jgi:conjugative transposon TraN protein
MKFLMFICALLSATILKAQQPAINLDGNTVIPAYNLDISWHKTTMLIFPAAIQSGDVGDKSILAETVKDVKNILKVKAGKKDFEQSNLQVVTVDGKVYSFQVNYNENAPSLPIDMGKQPPYAPITFKGISLNSKELETYAAKVAGTIPFMKGGVYRKQGMDFGLDGIYIKNDVLFFQFHLLNETRIPYDAASLRFYVRDKKSVKRTASQDKEILPVYVHQSGTPEFGKGKVIVVAFPKFTIALRKRLTTELMEQDGDRNPTTWLDQKKLLKARSL